MPAGKPTILVPSQIYDSKGRDIKFFLTPDRQAAPKVGTVELSPYS